MLQIKPTNRQTIVDILNKSFVRKKTAQYINELSGGSQDLAPTDVDDLYLDGLKEQAEKLMIPGFYDDSKNNGRVIRKRPKQNQLPPKEIKTQLE